MVDSKKSYPMVAQPNIPRVVVIPFWDGYRIYADLQVLIGGDHAERITRLVVDYCQQDVNAYYQSLAGIVNLPTTNPNNIMDVDDMIMKMGMEVYKAFYFHRLFTPTNTFGYRLHKVMDSGKLALFYKQTL